MKGQMRGCKSINPPYFGEILSLLLWPLLQTNMATMINRTANVSGQLQIKRAIAALLIYDHVTILHDANA
jgi:hypothetical protein